MVFGKAVQESTETERVRDDELAAAQDVAERCALAQLTSYKHETPGETARENDTRLDTMKYTVSA